jgi:hypothetical protein
MSDLHLSPEQLAFMLKNHERIERAIIESKKGNCQPLDEFINSDEFQSLLGEIGWDDAYDRYQDTPEYDKTLRIRLHEQLNKDITSGKVQIPIRRSHQSEVETLQDDDVNLDMLIKINVNKVK